MGLLVSMSVIGFCISITNKYATSFTYLLAPLTMRLVFDIFGLFAETNAFGVQLKYANYNPLVSVYVRKKKNIVFSYKRANKNG